MREFNSSMNGKVWLYRRVFNSLVINPFYYLLPFCFQFLCHIIPEVVSKHAKIGCMQAVIWECTIGIWICKLPKHILICVVSIKANKQAMYNLSYLDRPEAIAFEVLLPFFNSPHPFSHPINILHTLWCAGFMHSAIVQLLIWYKTNGAWKVGFWTPVESHGTPNKSNLVVKNRKF